MELKKKKIKKGIPFIILCVFIIGILIVVSFQSNYSTRQENDLILRIDHTVKILNSQIEDYPTEVNYLIKLYGREQYVQIGNCNMLITYEKPSCPCNGINEQFNIGYMVNIPVGEHYLYYPELQFNEFYNKFIIGNENLDSTEIEHYVSFIESKKMTEEGEKDTWSLKLRILKMLSGWVD